MNLVKSFGEIAVSFNQSGFLNATQIAKHFCKRPETYLKTEQTQQYIAALAEYLSNALKSVIDENQLVIVKNGSSKNGGGTWLHPKLAIHFARWLDPRFAVWCDEQIELILAGRLKASSSTTPDERKGLRQAVAVLAVRRGIDFSSAYHMLHQRFGVDKIEDLPREVLPEAVRYVHTLTLGALSGEVLDAVRPSENPSAITFSQSELRELAVVAYYCAWANDLLRGVAAPLAALGCDKAVTMRTLPVESAVFLRRVRTALLREMPKINSAFERADMDSCLRRCESLI